MNVQDLMIPRVKVVSGYPDSPYKVGDIMVFDGDLTIHPNGMDITSKYPHIFQPLPWYAERDIEDIPKYVRVNIKGHGEKILMKFTPISIRRKRHSRHRAARNAASRFARSTARCRTISPTG